MRLYRWSNNNSLESLEGNKKRDYDSESDILKAI